MAVQWIKFEHTTPDKPEIVAIGAALRVDHDTVVGKLLRIWVWADQNSVDGGTMRITEAFIDRLVSRKGFAAAMRKEKWLSGTNGALIFPNFSRHNGATAKKRSVENRAKTEWRDRTNVGQNTGQMSGSEQDKHRTNVRFRTGQTPDKCPAPNRTNTGQNNGPSHGPDEDEEKESKLSCASRSVGPAPPAAARAKLFGSLARAEGSDPAQLTKPGGKRIGVALKQLLAVDPSLTPDEIARRAGRYAEVMPAGTKLTAHALAMHWAKCGVKIPPSAPPEPENWRIRFERAYPDNAINKEGRSWSQVDVAAWAKVLEWEAANQ